MDAIQAVAQFQRTGTAQTPPVSPPTVAAAQVAAAQLDAIVAYEVKLRTDEWRAARTARSTRRHEDVSIRRNGHLQARRPCRSVMNRFVGLMAFRLSRDMLLVDRPFHKASLCRYLHSGAGNAMPILSPKLAWYCLRRDVIKKQKQLSRSEVVAEIRERILKGDLVPGQRLVESEICELLNTSRGTVRTALMDLAHEGLIERIANRGARVRVVSLAEALHIVEVRMAVESLCVAHAAKKITDREIGELRKMAAELADCAEKSDVIGYSDHTKAIFDFYVQIADQPVAADVLSRLRAQSTRHRYRLTFRAGRAQVSLPFWLAIVDAICRRDPVEAQAALRRLTDNISETMKAVAEEETPFARAFAYG